MGHNINWILKYKLRRIPFVGKASEIANHVFVDNSSPRAMTQTIDQAEKVLRQEVSIVIIPEGARSNTGRMSKFKKGAYIIATQMHVPIVPITLNGPFDVLKAHTKKLSFGKDLEIIVHDPVSTVGLTEDDIPELIKRTHHTIESSLCTKYK